MAVTLTRKRLEMFMNMLVRSCVYKNFVRNVTVSSKSTNELPYVALSDTLFRTSWNYEISQDIFINTKIKCLTVLKLMTT